MISALQPQSAGKRKVGWKAALLLGALGGTAVGAGFSELLRVLRRAQAAVPAASRDAEPIDERHARLLALHDAEPRDAPWAMEYEDAPGEGSVGDGGASTCRNGSVVYTCKRQHDGG
jgi:hypothetical protein